MALLTDTYRVTGINDYFLPRGYILLYLDYRGCGESEPKIRPDTPQEDYLKLRTDDIAHDIESVRLSVQQRLRNIGYRHELKFTYLGQSYGGYVASSLLSFHPGGLEKVMYLAGQAPVSATPDEVFLELYQQVIESNKAYYARYPEDIDVLWAIAIHLATRTPPYELPRHQGGLHKIYRAYKDFLTARRFLTIGRNFGIRGYWEPTHRLFQQMYVELQEVGALQPESLRMFVAEERWILHTRPTMAILYETEYAGKGSASNWSAYRLAATIFADEFWWVTKGHEAHLHDPGRMLRRTKTTPNPQRPNDETELGRELQRRHQEGARTPLFLSGEMIYPFFFQDWAPLQPYGAAADWVHQQAMLTDMYDLRQLAANTVPVTIRTFTDDMYVPFYLGRLVADVTGNMTVYEDDAFGHGALRSHTEVVLADLLAARARRAPVNLREALEVRGFDIGRLLLRMLCLGVEREWLRTSLKGMGADAEKMVV